MVRVAAYAKTVGAEIFKGSGMEANRSYIEKAMRAGKQIIDIGPDYVRRAERLAAGERPDSPFYNMERMVTKAYENYIRVSEIP